MGAALPLAVAAPQGGGLFAILDPLGAVLVLVFLIISLGVHEAAHAWVAWKRGDSTAKDLGRLTLNPIPHIDPIMTILLPTMMMMTMGWIFGGAKPVPVVYHRLKSPLRDMMLVAIAGPLSNLLLAIFFAAVRGIVISYTPHNQADMITPMVLHYAILFNLILAIFNMIPLPPLDGSRVMAWLLPESMRPAYVSLERFGFMLVMLMLFTGVFGTIIWNTLPRAWELVNTLTAGGAGSLRLRL